MSLSDLWQREACPILNGVVFAGGRVILMDIDERRSTLRVSQETSLSSLEASGQLHYTSCCPTCEAIDSDRGLRVLGGEAGWSGDGFIAAHRLIQNELLWIAFFAFANPFIEVKINGDAVVARNKLDELWTFPVASPERVTIAPPKLK